MRTQRTEGFTLIELMVAVAITAIIMTGVGGAFLGILQAREKVHSLSDTTSAGPRILALIERDLRGLWHHNIEGNRVFLGTNRDISGFPTDRIDLLTTTDAIGAIDDGMGTARWPSICEVGYWLKENPELPDLRELWRREDPMVDADITMGGTFQLVHDRIKSFEVTYFRTLGADAEPIHDWDSAEENELPRRMKIEFTVERNLPNVNRVSGSEVSDFEDTLLKYTRHIVFDRRYPEILRPGIAMVPVLPPAPAEEGTAAPIQGGGGGGGAGRGGSVAEIAGKGGISGVGTRGGGTRVQQPSGGGNRPGGPGGFTFPGFNGGGRGGGFGGLFGNGGGLFGGSGSGGSSGRGN